MPVTLYPSDVKPEEYCYAQTRANSTEQILKTPLQKGVPYVCKEIFQSSFSQNVLDSRNIHPSGSSFVRAAMNAYNRHHHLVIRPDDVWITILTQFSLYVNKHAEQLRSMFVAHEGKKQLTVTAVGTRYTVDLGNMALQMGEKIQENVVDPDLRSWLIQDFSTTDDNDRVVSSVIMMATLQKYFEYEFMCMCGLPGVTLLGEQSDWEALLQKLDKLESFGTEPSRFARLLRPILKRFVMCFTDPESEDLKYFWQQVIHHHSGGSGPSYISGWITAFCFWNADGDMQYPNTDYASYSDPSPMVYFDNGSGRSRPKPTTLELDSQKYGRIEDGHVVAGYAYVPVKLNDNGQQFDTIMVAGMVAIESRPTVERDSEWEEKNRLKNFSGPPPVNSVIQPIPGWWIFDAAEKPKGRSFEDW